MAQLGVFQVMAKDRKSRQRARLTCQRGHLWIIQSAHLEMEDVRWNRRSCPHCGRRPMAGLVLQNGRTTETFYFIWRIKIGSLKQIVYRLSRREQKAARERLQARLRGGGNLPILTRAQANGKNGGGAAKKAVSA